MTTTTTTENTIRPPPVSSVLMKAEDTATPQGDCGLMFHRFTKNKFETKFETEYV